ncbi:hypothetical protein BESB_076780 [Besnoitia besnoiti]|uniref:Tetratricopeptide repeat-containing protein n=1 Tax=Besnoitia besnoiti TaxID=94643 RepID=A0A2A9MAX8_BESBE|nr:hypothetical protein BESB_076780 [Besnoitia besnoiti]PFH33461.1 hypothetical protein BESB_076780 [Besnoitia besnoiti]
MIRPGTAVRWQRETARPQAFSVSSEAPSSSELISRKLPPLEEFLRKRDYVGAITLLEYEREQGTKRRERRFWLAYCYFHAGLYSAALKCCDQLLKRGKKSCLDSQEEGHGSVGERAGVSDLASLQPSGDVDEGKGVGSAGSTPAANGSSARKEWSVPSSGVHTQFLDREEDGEDDGDDEGNSSELTPDKESELHLYKAICLYGMYMFPQAKQEALQAANTKTRNRLLLCIAYHESDPDLDRKLEALDTSDFRDQMTAAAVEYMRGRPDVACDIYRKLLSAYPEYHALKIYYAMAAFKGEMFEIARGLVKEYEGCHARSLVASNLLACCLYEEDAASSAMEIYHLLGHEADREESFFIQHNDLLRHNACVFQKGEKGLQVWRALIGIIPEARLNLTLLHMRTGDYESAFSLMHDFDPRTANEYTIRALAFMLLGQARDSAQHICEAQNMFLTVGTADGEIESIPGMQSMFYYYFLRKDYDAALAYASRLEPYFGSEPSYRWNKALALSQEGRYEEVKAAISAIDDEEYLRDPLFLRWLCRVYVATGDCDEAICLCLQQNERSQAHALLKEVADDCYAIGDFYFALKAFCLLDKADANPLLWPALRGAAAGFLLKLRVGREDISRIKEATSFLRDCSATKMVNIAAALRQLGRAHGLLID